LEAANTTVARSTWSSFCKGKLPRQLGPHFLAAWQAAERSDFEAVLAVDAAFTTTLEAEECRRSTIAGHLLLKSTRHARYQGWLERYRTACEQGSSPGHFLTAWAGVAIFFQTSLAAAAMEYLRLEWGILTWNLSSARLPPGLDRIAGKMVEKAGVNLRLLD
jgi:urease accessory protein UreF